MTVSTNPYTLEDLTAEITYYAYIRAKYEDGNSAWTDKVVFKPSNTMDLTVNDGQTTNEYIPIYGYYLDNVSYGVSEFVIPAESLTMMKGREVKKLTFYSSSENSSWGNPEFEVYLKIVENTTFNRGDAFDWTGTKVYTGNPVIANGKMEIVLDDTFNYEEGNLMIGFKANTTGTYGHYYFYGISESNSALRYSSSYNSTTENFLPKVTILSDPIDDTPTAKMEVASDDIDFGKITPETAAEDKQKTFTISNTGNADLTGITVVFQGDNVFNTTTVSDATIAADGEAIEVTVTMNTETAGNYAGAITVSATNQEAVTINVSGTYITDPIMTVYTDAEGTAEAVSGENINFGLVETAPTYTYYVKNTGAGTLAVEVEKAGFTVSPETASLTSGQQQAFTITALTGSNNGTVTFTGKNGEEEVGTFAVTIQGDVMDTSSKFFEGFDEASVNDLTDWVIENNTVDVAIVNSYIYYWASTTETGSITTPKLYVSGADDTMYYKAYGNGSYGNVYGSAKAIVSYSADKVNWTTAATIINTDLGFGIDNAKVFSINGIPEGNWYIKFEISDVAIDYVYGFTDQLAILALDQNTANTITTGVQDITLNYVFSKAAGRNYNTIAVPFEITDLSIFGEGVKAYTLQSYDEANSNVTFSEVETLEAGKPYMLHADTPTSESTFNFYNVDVTSVDEGETAITGVTFHANYSYKAAGDISGEWYGVNSTTGNVQKAGTTTHLLAFRGYFTFDGTVDPARLNVTFLDNDGGATSINGTEVFNNQTGDIYDLSGRKVLNAQKGIYIQNGKKVVIK